jgi:hypothetical protein
MKWYIEAKRWKDIKSADKWRYSDMHHVTDGKETWFFFGTLEEDTWMFRVK